MTSVDTAVRNLITSAPEIIENRTEALHFLLCVPGNGYVWSEHGTLVPYDGIKLKPWKRERYLSTFREFFSSLPAEVQEELMEPRKKEADRLQHIVDAVDDLVNTRVFSVKEMYPQANNTSAAVLKIPANVTADWREACDEIIALATQNGWKF